RARPSPLPSTPAIGSPSLRGLCKMRGLSLGLGLHTTTALASNIFTIAGLDGLEFWYDPSDLSTVFQDAAGTTPGAAGSPVGLLLDKHLGGELGPELRSTGEVQSVGPATVPATYDPNTGEGTASRIDTSDASAVRIEGLTIGFWYFVDIETTSDATASTSVR